MVVVLAALVLLAGCGGNHTDAENIQDRSPRASSGEQVHPMPERLPHAEVSPVSVSDAAPCNLTSVPASVERLQAHVEGNDAMADARRIPIDVPGGSDVEVASLNENLVLLLITLPRISELWSYHIPTERAERVATRGQGPGELMFPTDLAVRGSEVYVSMGTMRIATFTCEGASCTHREDIRTQFQPTQIEVSGDRFATTGQLPLRGETEIDALDGAIHYVNPTGTLVESFGEPYQTDVWMVSAHFARYKQLASLTDGSHVVHYHTFPRVYAYGADQPLRQVIEIDDFLQPTFVYEDGRRSVLREDNYSRIKQLNALTEGTAFLTVATVRMDRPSEAMETGNEIRYLYDYYLMGATSGCASHLGHEDVAAEYGVNDRIRWVPTEHHLLRIGEGSVHLIDRD
ncbi:hypothetical protein CRI93_12675 [Longimonas halophila]|uniref:Cyclic nucleotide-binding domain-containing protein n=1 Tax=Longimonas halophila TaxID=1469170 RepID=A0A2H3P4S1_9BACT|nr:hypothetical protein CRI93_12675 [Longimonas halophila]